MFNWIDSLIDNITMYRLLLYYLIGLIVAAFGLSIVGDLHFNPLYVAGSAIILVAASWIINKVLAYIFYAPTNPESALITALILALIITPNPTGFNLLFMLAAAGLAMASKYILTIREKHLFNPAAIAVVLTALGPKQTASWWVGTAVMLPFVLIGGLLLIRKIHRGTMFSSFLIATTLSTILYSVLSKVSVSSSLQNMVLSSSVFFLGFVMLTEPATSPTTKTKQTWYGAIVGFLLPPQVHFFSFYTTPEIALVVGNIFSYLVSPKTKLFPVLKQKIKIASNTADFVFSPGRALAYEPGQYMEWTLPHKKYDARGIRRYFTLASSPTEHDIRIGVKFYEKGSTFKSALLDSDEYSPFVATEVSGDFVMPKDTSQKLLFIAGGIGITPFRSMIKYLIDSKQARDIILLYSARTQSDLVYQEVFNQASRELGIKVRYVVTNQQIAQPTIGLQAGRIDAKLLEKETPDITDRLCYISGTHLMVKDMKTQLLSLGVASKNIKTDYFPGYA